MKVLQVHLNEDQHKRLRVLAAERCVAMSELVRWWIDGVADGLGPVRGTGPAERGGKAARAVVVPAKVVAVTDPCAVCGGEIGGKVVWKGDRRLCLECGGVK